MANGSAVPDPDFIALQAAVAGEYSIERELGRGGMGTVYLAREVRLDRLVALKLLPRHLTAVPGVRERFLREARIAARLSHPNIVPVYRVEERGDLVFFAMAYVPGETLAARLQRLGRLPAAECARVLQAVAWALAEAHRHGVVHRDVKPENILIEARSGRPMVVDFGIARGTEAGSATGKGELLGTVRFMSPEQFGGAAVDARSDVYSLGVVGYLAASGQLPFDGGSAVEIFARQATEQPTRLRALVPSLPAGLVLIIERCIARAPEERFPGAQDLAVALEGVGEPTISMPPALRIWLTGREAVISVPGFVLFLAVSVLLLSGLQGWRPTSWAWGAVIAIPIAFRLWVRLAALRGLLSQGLGLEDVQRGMRELEGEEREAEAVLGSMRANRLTSTVIAAGGLLWGAVEINALAPRWKKLSKEFWSGSVAQALVRVLSYRLPRQSAVPAYAIRKTEVVVCDAVLGAFDALPQAMRAGILALPTVVRGLERRIRLLRARLGEVEGMLADLGVASTHRRSPPAEAVDALAAVAGQRLRTVRADLERQVESAVAVLERLRIGLMLLRVGSGTPYGLGEEVKLAENLGLQIDRLLAGQHEVALLLDVP
jgi:serine/threonine-protein kinase